MTLKWSVAALTIAPSLYFEMIFGFIGHCTQNIEIKIFVKAI